jgi:hypothetical protein
MRTSITFFGVNNMKHSSKASQANRFVIAHKISLPSRWGKWILPELEKEKGKKKELFGRHLSPS